MTQNTEHTLVCWWLPLWKCIYILWNRLDRICYKCIIRLHDYVPYEALKSRLLCLGFPHNSHKLCLKIDMIIINKCCIAHWTVLIHISMYFVKFSVIIFYKGFTGCNAFLVLQFMFRDHFRNTVKELWIHIYKGHL